MAETDKTVFQAVQMMGRNRLTLKELNNILRHKTAGVATRWYELGVELLDSNTAVLDVIKTSHQRDDGRCSEMFKTWLEMKPDASWSQLVTALHNIGLNTAADNVRQVSMKETMDMLVVKKSEADFCNMINTAELASVEFGILLNEILKELKKNENENLELLKTISSTLTVQEREGARMFSDIELEGIHACDNIKTLLVIKLRHCYRWDDHSMLTVLMSSLNAKKSLKLLHLFETKLYSKMKLQQIHEHCLQESREFPEGYHKMITIVNKTLSSITKEEYDELKQFISQHCGVEAYVMSPFSKASPFFSVVFEWLIPANAVSYMIKTAQSHVNHILKQNVFVYLKISSTVIFDQRDNKSECDQLLEAARTNDVATVIKLINTRYIDVNVTDAFNQTALHLAASNGNIQVVEMLIELGADLNALDMLKWIALHDAANNGHLQVVEMLVSFGADVNAVDMDNDNPLQIALQGGHRRVVQFMVKEAKVDTTQLKKSTQSKIKQMLQQSDNLEYQIFFSLLSTWRSDNDVWSTSNISSQLPQYESRSPVSEQTSTTEGGQDKQLKCLEPSSELSKVQSHTSSKSSDDDNDDVDELIDTLTLTLADSNVFM